MSCDCGLTFNLCVDAGATLHPVFRWATSVITSVAITGITNSAPAVVTAPSHGLPDGWPCAVVSAQGMTQINSPRYPPRGSDWTKGTVLTSSTVQLNAVNSADWPAWTSGGYLVYSTPATLTGVTATMTIWDAPGGNVLSTLTSTGGQIVIDATKMTVTPTLQTAALTWTSGFYRLDMTDSSGTVTQLAEGSITIE